MQPARSLNELRQLSAASGAEGVLPSLRNDPLIWAAVQDTAFLQRLSQESASGRVWTPGWLALLAVDSVLDPEVLREEPLVSLPADVNKKALSLFEDCLHSGRPPRTLAEAGLLALAMRERRRRTGTWKGLAADLAPRGMSAQHALRLWKTPLACGYSLVTDQADFLSGLKSAHDLQPFASFVSHVLLTNPMGEGERVRAFAGQMVGMPLQKQVEWLQMLYAAGLAELTSQLSRILLEGEPDPAAELSPQLFSWSDWAGSEDGGHLRAALYFFAGEMEAAVDFLAQAKRRLSFGQAMLNLQTAAVMQSGGAWQAALEEAKAALAAAPDAEAVMAASDQILQQAARRGLSAALEGVDSPLVSLAIAWQDFKLGNVDNGRSRAISAVEDLLVQSAAGTYQELPPGSVISPAEWVGHLVQMGLAQEACSLGEQFTTQRPMDARLLAELSEAYRHEGRMDRAVQAASEIILLEPPVAEHYKRLALLWEEQGEWDKAADERSRAFELLDNPDNDERLQVASTLLRAGRPADAERMASDAVTTEPENPLALSILGMARAQQGDHSGAIELLKQAAEQSNDLALPWIELARVYELQGDNQSALDTLRAGLVLFDQSAELLYSLGKTCLRLGLSSEALPYFRQAAAFNPEKPELSASLSETLDSLGHQEEALEVIVSARARWPELPQLSFQHAQLLTRLGRDIEALSALEAMLEAEEAPDAWTLLYAQILHNVFMQQSRTGSPDYSLLNRAQHALQQVINHQPEHYEARLLMAEVVLQKGHAESALNRLGRLLEEESETALSFRWRVQAGVGEACYRLGRTETALVAFQAAAKEKPEKIEVWRRLADTYLAAHLYEEAELSAETALQLADDDLRNLVWYAEFMRQMGRFERAEQALRRGINLDRDRGDMVVQLADILIRRGEEDEAVECLSSVAHMAETTLNNLRQAAYLYLDLNHEDEALHCLDRGCSEMVNPGAGPHFEKSCLLYRMGDYPASLDALQQALRYQPDRIELRLAQADLLARCGEMSKALNALEKALHSRPDGTEQRWEEVLTGYSSLVPASWQRGNLATDELNMRYAVLLRHHGQIDQAAQRAEECLVENSDDLAMRFFLAELAFSRLELQRAAEIIEERVSLEQRPEADASDSLRSALCSLRAEIALTSGSDEDGWAWLEAASLWAPDHPRQVALKIRRMAAAGDLPTAETLFDELVLTFQAADGVRSGVSWAVEQGSGTWFADAALAAGRWQVGLSLLRRLSVDFPMLPGYQLALVRGLVLAAEAHSLCDQLNCQTHSPGSALGEAPGGEFDAAVQPVDGYEVVRQWKLRGQAVFRADEGVLQALGSELKVSPEGIQTYLHAARQLEWKIDADAIRAQFPNHAAVHAELALTALANGDMELAETAQQAVALAPRNPLWHALYACVADSNGEKDLAYDALRIALSLWPDEPRWQAWAGELADRSGARQESVEHWLSACEHAPENAAYRCRLGNAYLSFGQYDQALEILREVTENDPENVEGWVGLARTYMAVGQLEPASNAVQQAIGLDDQDARPLTVAGEVSLASNDPFEALQMAEKARALAPRDEYAVMLQSRALVQLDHEDQALQVLEEALEEGIGGENLQVERIRLMRKKDGGTRSRAELERLVKVYPNSADLLGMLAFTLADCGDYKGAEHYAALSLRQQPIQPNLHLLLGYIYRGAGHLDQAVYHFSSAVELDPKDLEAYLELGKAYQQRREQHEAMLVFQQAMALSPEDHRPFYQAALLMFESKEYKDAEQLLRKAVELAPNDLNIRRKLGAVIALNLVQHSQETNS